jgi:LmbE family N-acetylglucosaminyl deacetylase
MSNILFIFAHPDDEAYGPAGTIAKLSKDNKVTVCSLCDGSRPGHEHVRQSRGLAFLDSCKLLGASSYIWSNPDCTLEYAPTLKLIENLIVMHNPSAVYTHNISDIHKDHRIVAECCMVACRPKPGSEIKSLYFSETASSTDWSFGQIHPHFVPNTYVDITDHINTKIQALCMYHTEVYEYPDARSAESVMVQAKNRGKQIGVKFAEAFHQVFRIDT